MSQVSSDFDEPLLGDDDLVADGGFGEVGFGDDLTADSLNADGLDADGWDDADAAMAAPVSRGPQKKEGFSIYTVMLIMSFVFLTTAAILIFIELGRL